MCNDILKVYFSDKLHQLGGFVHDSVIMNLKISR